MGHRTTVNVNVKINDFINYSKAGKAFSLLTLRKMVDNLSDAPVEDEPYTIFTSVMHVIGKDSVNVIDNVAFDINNGVMPYVKADFDSELEAGEEDVLDNFIDNVMDADYTLINKVQEIVANHVTTF